MTFNVSKETTTEEVNQLLEKAANGPLKGVLDFTMAPLVSIDFNGCPASSTIDGASTKVIGKMVKVLSWYDNETGFSHRMLDVARLMTK